LGVQVPRALHGLAEPGEEDRSGYTGRRRQTKGVTGVTQSSTEERRTSPATFYRQVVAELRKVVWPTRTQLVTYFWVVLVFVLVVMTFVSLLDLAFGRAVFAIFA
jgi:preprotein translocase subunit SecE